MAVGWCDNSCLDGKKACAAPLTMGGGVGGAAGKSLADGTHCRCTYHWVSWNPCQVHCMVEDSLQSGITTVIPATKRSKLWEL